MLGRRGPLLVLLALLAAVPVARPNYSGGHAAAPASAASTAAGQGPAPAPRPAEAAAAAAQQQQKPVLWQVPDIPWRRRFAYADLVAAHPLLQRAEAQKQQGSDAGGDAEQPQLGALAGAAPGARGPTSFGRCVQRRCRLLGLVPGLGGGMLDHKLSIFRRNRAAVEAAAASAFEAVHWRVHSFDASQFARVAAELDDDGGGGGRLRASARVVPTAGYMGDVVREADASGFDYVMMFADDVELRAGVDWPLLLAVQQVHGLDVVTGCIAPANDTSDELSWYDHMPCRRHALPGALTVVEQQMVEQMHGNLFTAEGFARFQSFMDPANSYGIWGSDWLMHMVMGLRVGRVSFMPYVHWYGSDDTGSYSRQRAHDDMVAFFDRLHVPASYLTKSCTVGHYAELVVTHYVTDEAAAAAAEAARARAGARLRAAEARASAAAAAARAAAATTAGPGGGSGDGGDGEEGGGEGGHNEL